MNFIKKYLKIIIGAGVLVTVLFVFAMSVQSGDLSTGTLQNWPSASVDERITTIRTLVGSDKDTDILVACVDKMATLPDSDQMTVADATRLCNLGLQLKPNL